MRWPFVVTAVMVALPTLGAQQQLDPRRFPNREAVIRELGPEASAAGVVIGRVIDAETGRGIPRATVLIAGKDRAFPIATDPLGRYYFVDLPAGDYQITAEKPGFAPGEFGRLRPDGPGYALSLLPGEWRADGHIRLWRTGAITGYVGNEINEPVVGVRVHALRREFVANRLRIGSVHTTTTDDRGLFRLSGLVPGNYLVMTPSTQVIVPLETLERVADTGRPPPGLGVLMSLGTDLTAPDAGSRLLAGLVWEDEDRVRFAGMTATPPRPDDGRVFAYRTQYYPAADIPAIATTVPVEAGGEFSGISFYLRPVATANVSGDVIGPDGLVADQLLRLLPESGEDFGPGFETAVTISREDGSFFFSNVPPGSYVIDARTTSGAPPAAASTADDDAAPGRPPIWARVPVTVSARDVEGLAVVMAEGASVTGAVTFERTFEPPDAVAVEAMRITLRPARDGTDRGQATRPGDDRTFVMSGIVPGEYVVDVEPPPGWFVASITGGGRDLSSQALVVADQASMAMSVRLTDTPTELTGTVRDRRGVVASTATVLLVPADSDDLPPLRTRETRVNTKGQFRIRGLLPGTYRVVAIEDAEAGSWQEPHRLSVLKTRARTVSIRSSGLWSQDLVLQPGR